MSLVDDASGFVVDSVGELEHGSVEEGVDGHQREGEGQEHGQAGEDSTENAEEL